MIDEKKFESLEKLFNELLETIGSTNMTCEEIETETELFRSEFQRLKKGGWVPVSERLPEEKQYYFVTYEVPGLPNYYTTETYLGSLSDGTKKWEIEEEHSNYKVIAWMERPKPYIPPEETQLCTNNECTYNADGNLECPAWNGCGGYQSDGAE